MNRLRHRGELGEGIVEATGALHWSQAKRNYTLAIILAASVLSILDRQVLAVLLVPIKVELSLSDTQVGLLTGVLFSGFYLIAGFPMGALVDRRDRRKIMAWCLVVWSIATMAAGLATSFVQLALTRTIVAIGEAGCVPASSSIIVDIYPPERRVRALAILNSTAAIGLGMGILLGGVLGQLLGWRFAFVAVGAPGLLFALALLYTTPEPRRGEEHHRAVAATTVLKSLRQLVTLSSYRAVMVIAVFASTSILAMLAWIPTLLVRVHGMSTTELGWKLGIATALGLLVGNLTCGLVAGTLSRKDLRWLLWLPAAALSASIPFGLAAIFARSDNVVIGCAWIFMLLSGFWSPPILTIAIGLAGSHARGLAAATMPLFTALGGAIGPAFVGYASDNLFADKGQAAIQYALAPVLAGLAFAALTAVIAAGKLRAEVVAN